MKTKSDRVQRRDIGGHAYMGDRHDDSYEDDDAPAPAPRKETIVNEDLKSECTKHAVKYDSDDRAAALTLLARLGYPGDHVTASDKRLDAASEAYVVAYAIAKARGHADELKIRSAAQRGGYDRVDHTDAEREERIDTGVPRYDARIGEELYDMQAGELGSPEPGALRFDSNGYLIGDYRRSDSHEDARQEFLDRQATAWMPKKERKAHLKYLDAERRIDDKAHADAEQFGTRHVPHVSSAELEAERRKTDKARQDMLDSHPRVADPLAPPRKERK